MNLISMAVKQQGTDIHSFIKMETGDTVIRALLTMAKHYEAATAARIVLLVTCIILRPALLADV